MIPAMTAQVTSPPKASGVFEFQPAGDGVSGNNRDVKINQMGIIGRIPLGTADAMGVVADITGSIFPNNMFSMNPLPEITGGIDNGLLIMALIAKAVHLVGFRGIIGSFVAEFHNLRINRSVRSRRNPATVAGVAVGAINDTAFGVGRQQTGNTRICAGTFNGMKRGITDIKFQAHVVLLNLARGGAAGFIRAVRVTTVA